MYLRPLVLGNVFEMTKDKVDGLLDKLDNFGNQTKKQTDLKIACFWISPLKDNRVFCPTVSHSVLNIHKGGCHESNLAGTEHQALVRAD